MLENSENLFMKRFDKEILLELMSEIQSTKSLKGFTSFTQGEEKKEIQSCFKDFSISPFSNLVDFYYEFKEYKFHYSLRSTVEINYINREVDIICGKCNLIDLKTSLKLLRDSKKFLLEIFEDEYYIGLEVVGNKILDKIFLFDNSEQEWRNLNLTFIEYLNAICLFKGFNRWQFLFLNKKPNSKNEVFHYLPQIFEVSQTELRDGFLAIIKKQNQ